jgi:sulfide:quinone oxidoreductase
MKQLLILGAGTAGTIMANRIVHVLDPEEWRITCVDCSEKHYYQPGFLFIPFGMYDRADVVRPTRDYMPPGVELVFSEIEVIEPQANRVRIAKEHKYLPYDFLVVATGVETHPEETPGMAGDEWYRTIFDFYTPEGAVALAKFLRTWEGGRLVLDIVDMPIKCPVAPLEFMMLADWFFHEHGIRDRVELVMATPLPGAFTKPRASQLLGDILNQKGIRVEAEFNVEHVDPDAKKIVSYDEREIPYDVLVSVPLHMGAEAIARSGMGDELNYVDTDRYTLKAKAYDNVFVLGDATNLPSSKAGSVAHYEIDGFIDNFLRYVDGMELRPTFDGHANCYIESGFGQGILIDFNYDVEPLPGMFPLPGIGPFSLLQESRVNHWGKMIFRWMYWNILLKGKTLPLPAQMMMAGKWR